MTDPHLISLDIETYGICAQTTTGVPLPRQTVFHPARSLATDRCPRSQLIQTVALTLPTTHTTDLHLLRPGPTFVFLMHKPHHRRQLAAWLSHATIILGMNLQFDLLYLRSQPDFRFHLQHQTLIDLSVLNYLHSELRPEKSLKSLGPILGTHLYPPSQIDKTTRYPHANSPHLATYNAADTHNTLLATAELARRIRTDYSPTDKLSPACLAHYSDTIWTVIRMSEAGVPLSLPDLRALKESTTLALTNIHSSSGGLILEGKGSAASKLALHHAALTLVETIEPTIRSHQLLQYTEIKKELAVNDLNRQLLSSYLNQIHTAEATELLAQLAILSTHSSLQKLLSSYIYPLLHHQRMNPEKKDSVLISRPNSPTGISYPTWYITPSPTKDGSGSEGGTLQGRITCKGFRHQTDPDPIKALYKSRYPHGLIVGYDLAQIEMVVAGLLSHDPSLCAAFLADPPLDLHTERAIQVFGPQITADPQFKKVYRQTAKHANFGDLFRAGAKTLQSTILKVGNTIVPLSLCENIVKTRPFVRPGLWQWQEKLINDTRTRGYIELPFIGQSRTFMGGDAYDISEIVNMPIQCTAGNILLKIQHHLHRTLPPINHHNPFVHMTLNVYDAIYFDLKHPSHLPTLDNLVADAVHHISTAGYWHQLCLHYGHTLPLRYERTIYNEPTNASHPPITP